MMILGFQHFSVPVGINGRDRREGDARESFADTIYLGATGIRAHALALKIYNSQGKTNYTPEEVAMITSVAERFCTPAFIDGLRAEIRTTNVNPKKQKDDD